MTITKYMYYFTNMAYVLRKTKENIVEMCVTHKHCNSYLSINSSAVKSSIENMSTHNQRTLLTNNCPVRHRRINIVKLGILHC